MTTKNVHFEGQADGTTPTVANSSTYGDDALSTVLATAMTLTYSGDLAAHGNRSLKFGAGDATAKAYIGLGGFSTTTFGVRAYFNFGAIPTVNTRIIAPINATGSGNMGGFSLKTDGTVSFVGVDATTVLATSSPTTQVISLNTWYRFEAYWNISATAGSYHAAVYAGDSLSPWFSYTSSSTMNTGTTPIAEVRVGKLTYTSGVSAISSPWYLDDFAASDTATAFIGPYVAPGPAIATTVTPGYAILDATGSTAAAGGTLTYSLDPSIGVIQPTPGIFYVPQESTAASYTLTVAEAGGGTTISPVTVPSLTTAASSQTTVMVSRFIGGAWQ